MVILILIRLCVGSIQIFVTQNKKNLKSGFKKMYKTSFPLRYLPFYDLNLITSLFLRKCDI